MKMIALLGLLSQSVPSNLGRSDSAQHRSGLIFHSGSLPPALDGVCFTMQYQWPFACGSRSLCVVHASYKHRLSDASCDVQKSTASHL